MHRLLAVALLSLALPAAGAQTLFSAPNAQNVTASSEVSGSEESAHLLYVTNSSTVPIIVFGITLSDCENIRQACGGRKVNVKIDPNERRQVGRVDFRSTDKASNYRWGFSYRPDSSDARMIAAMNAAGSLVAGGTPVPPEAATRVTTSLTPVEPESPPPARLPERPSIMVADALPPLIASEEVGGVAQATSAIAPTRHFFVTNSSAYPIVVYSLNFASCVNVKQMCGKTPVKVRVPARGRADIGRVDAQDRTKRYSYEWTYDWHPDTTDARVAQALAARGQREGPMGHAENLAVQPPADAAPTGARGSVTFLDAQNRPVATSERFRFKVSRESILGSTQQKGATVRATGACVDPGEIAALERDTTVTGSPAVPPRLTATSIAMPSVPANLRDSTAGPVRITARWVVDLDGQTIPGSASILESTNALMSVQTCGAVIAARLEPGRDAAGRPVRTWVEVPLSIQR